MTEQENELLEMYIRYIKKRNLIIFIIVFIVVALGVFGLYKIKNINIRDFFVKTGTFLYAL